MPNPNPELTATFCILSQPEHRRDKKCFLLKLGGKDEQYFRSEIYSYLPTVLVPQTHISKKRSKLRVFFFPQHGILVYNHIQVRSKFLEAVALESCEAYNQSEG